MLCFLFSFDLRRVENWAEIYTKVASRRSFAFEASLCGAFKSIGDGGKLLNRYDFDPHDPETWMDNWPESWSTSRALSFSIQLSASHPRGSLNTFSEAPHTTVRNVTFPGSVTWSAIRVTPSSPKIPCRHSP
jgi:hypothetical protein